MTLSVPLSMKRVFFLATLALALTQVLVGLPFLRAHPRTYLAAAYEFSRMLHGAPSSSGGTVDAFYRAFVPDVASTMNPRHIELVKRCHRTERGEPDRVGATVFPGLVKVSRGPPGPDGKSTETVQTVVRRAQVICECAMLGGAGAIGIPGSASPPVASPPIGSPTLLSTSPVSSGMGSPAPSTSPPTSMVSGVYQ